MKFCPVLIPVLCSLFVRVLHSQAEPSVPCNVVLVLIDDLGWKDLGCYGSTFYETPNIDRLCREGMMFTDAYSACNVCSPSRHAILTGKYPAPSHFTNILNWKPLQGKPLCDPQQDDVLNDSEITLAERFQAAGYRTGFVGKWDMNVENWQDLFAGREHGFDEWNSVKTEGGWTPPRIVEDVDDPKEVSEITDWSIRFVEDAVAEQKPFMLYMAHHTVHTELQTTQALHDKYSAKAPGTNGQDNPFMGGMIEDLDREFGRFVSRLEALGVRDQTVIVFTSDNGGLSEQLGDRVTTQAPLRGGKGDAWEGGTRVPLIFNGPGIASGTVTDVPVIQIDLYPTLPELAGIPLTGTHVFDGVSLVPVLNGESAESAPVFERPSLFWHYPHYKAITQPYSSIRKGDWKLIVYHEEELGVRGAKLRELYNLSDDVGEQNNLISVFPEKAAELYRDILRYRQETDAQMPSVNAESTSRP